VPEHQPNSPHAELHHPPAAEDDASMKPLEEQQLKDAITVQVKLEEGLEAATQPVQPEPAARPTEELVKGPTLVDDAIVNDVRSPPNL
jgi:hypothetical protein